MSDQDGEKTLFVANTEDIYGQTVMTILVDKISEERIYKTK
jgi:hypothetical protein